MKSPIAVLLVATGSFCSLALAYGGDAQLHGCWMGEEVIQFFADGRSVKSTPKACVLEFGEDRITSGCGDIVYGYRVIRAGEYTATMVSHSSRPDLVGGAREYEYKIEGDHMFITTYPQKATPTPPTQAVRVESRSRRSSCK